MKQIPYGILSEEGDVYKLDDIARLRPGSRMITLIETNVSSFCSLNHN